MVFHVIVLTFLMALLLYKFSSVVINDSELDEIHVNYRHKVWYNLHSNIHVMKCQHK